MHVMFIHPNFPAQFGHIAYHLATERGWPCTCVTSIDTQHLKLPFIHINYKIEPGPQPKVFHNPGSFDGMMAHMKAVYRGLKSAPQIQPDLVVGHMSYGTMLFLRNLYRCPFVGYFELLPAPFWTEGLSLRPDYPPPEETRLFNATYHTFTYLHLHAVDAAYTPTNFQLHSAPPELRYKIRTIFDGVDTEVFQRREIPRPTTFRGIEIPSGTKVVTYVSRGLESSRGFDIFMRVAKRICDARSDVIFLIAGEDRTHYGHELHHIGQRTFKEYVLAQDKYDLSRIHFLDRIPIEDLVTLYCLSDLHVYLTVPWVLSWSLMQGMSTGCTVLGSATAPVQEVIEDGQNGLLADFYDVDGLTERALRVLDDPAGHRHLGDAARQVVLERYEKKRCINQLVELFEEVARKGTH